MANQEEKEFNLENLILCTIVKIDNSDATSLQSSPPSSRTNSKNAKNKQTDPSVFISLPQSIDPNLGLTEYLPPLNLNYEAKMNQPWNIAPYFLETLTQSPCCELSDCILLFGGLNPTHPNDLVLGSSVFEYHVSYKKWRYYGCMLEPRCYHQTSKTDSYVYITGGYSFLLRSKGEMVAIPKTHRLDIKTTLWSERANMNTPRACHAMVAVNENLYVFGGRDCNGKILTSVEVYDPDENEWNIISHMPAPLMGLSATVADNRIWLVGGITVPNNDYDHPSVSASVYSFSPFDGRWLTHDHLPSPHAFSSCVSNNSAIWVVGGSHFSKQLMNQSLESCACILELSLHSQTQWNRIADLPTPTLASATALCGDSIVSIGGVHSWSNSATNAVQIINLLKKAIKPSVPLPAKVAGASVVYFPRKVSNNRRMNDRNACLSEGMANDSDSANYLSSTQTPAVPDPEFYDYAFENTINMMKFQSMKQDGGFRSDNYPPYSSLPSSNLQNYSDISSQQPSNTLSNDPRDREEFMRDLKSAGDIPGTFIYVKDIPSSKQYVTSVKIPLNDAKLLRKDDTTDESQDIDSSELSGRNFKLYSPPSRWKDRIKSNEK